MSVWRLVVVFAAFLAAFLGPQTNALHVRSRRDASLLEASGSLAAEGKAAMEAETVAVMMVGTEAFLASVPLKNTEADTVLHSVKAVLPHTYFQEASDVLAHPHPSSTIEKKSKTSAPNPLTYQSPLGSKTSANAAGSNGYTFSKAGVGSRSAPIQKEAAPVVPAKKPAVPKANTVSTTKKPVGPPIANPSDPAEPQPNPNNNTPEVTPKEEGGPDNQGNPQKTEEINTAPFGSATAALKSNPQQPGTTPKTPITTNTNSQIGGSTQIGGTTQIGGGGQYQYTTSSQPMIVPVQFVPVQSGQQGTVGGAAVGGAVGGVVGGAAAGGAGAAAAVPQTYQGPTINAPTLGAVDPDAMLKSTTDQTTITSWENGPAITNTYTTNTEVIDLPGLDFLGYGFDAKDSCSFEQCGRQRIISWTYNDSRRVVVMDKIYRLPDQVKYEPIYETNAYTSMYESKQAFESKLVQSASVKGSGGGFSGAVNQRFSTASLSNSECYLAQRSINVVLYQLSLGYYGTCDSGGFEKTFCDDIATLKAKSSDGEVDPFAYYSFAKRWGVYIVASVKLGGTLEMNIAMEKTQTSSATSFGISVAAAYDGLFASVSASASVETAQSRSSASQNMHVSLLANGGDPRVASLIVDLNRNTHFTEEFQHWIGSIPDHPRNLGTVPGLIPMTDMYPGTPSERLQFEFAVSQYQADPLTDPYKMTVVPADKPVKDWDNFDVQNWAVAASLGIFQTVFEKAQMTGSYICDNTDVDKLCDVLANEYQNKTGEALSDYSKPLLKKKLQLLVPNCEEAPSALAWSHYHRFPSSRSKTRCVRFVARSAGGFVIVMGTSPTDPSTWIKLEVNAFPDPVRIYYRDMERVVKSTEIPEARAAGTAEIFSTYVVCMYDQSFFYGKDGIVYLEYRPPTPFNPSNIAFGPLSETVEFNNIEIFNDDTIDCPMLGLNTAPPTVYDLSLTNANLYTLRTGQLSLNMSIAGSGFVDGLCNKFSCVFYKLPGDETAGDPIEGDITNMQYDSITCSWPYNKLPLVPVAPPQFGMSGNYFPVSIDYRVYVRNVLTGSNLKGATQNKVTLWTCPRYMDLDCNGGTCSFDTNNMVGACQCPKGMYLIAPRVPKAYCGSPPVPCVGTPTCGNAACVPPAQWPLSSNSVTVTSTTTVATTPNTLTQWFMPGPIDDWDIPGSCGLCTAVPLCVEIACNSYNASSCLTCEPGAYLDGRKCTLCPADHYCPGGVEEPVLCPNNTLTDSGSSKLEHCRACESGLYVGVSLTTGRRECKKCTLIPGCKQTSCTNAKDQICDNCDAGTFRYPNNPTGCQQCPMDSYCSSSLRLPCPADTFAPLGSSDISACTPCAPGQYITGTPLNFTCSVCQDNFMCPKGAAVACPTRQYSRAGALKCEVCGPDEEFSMVPCPASSASTAAAGAASSGPAYIGCWNFVAGGALNKQLAVIADWPKCWGLAQAGAYRYVGQMGDECWAGNAWPGLTVGSKQLDEGLCVTVCASSPTGKCGSIADRTSISVYENTAVKPLTGPAPAVDGISYMGCMRDAEQRAFPKFLGTSTTFQGCVDLGRKEGIRFIGQEVAECYGSNDWPTITRLGSGYCDSVCTSPTGFCGGVWSLSVYDLYPDSLGDGSVIGKFIASHRSFNTAPAVRITTFTVFFDKVVKSIHVSKDNGWHPAWNADGGNFQTVVLQSDEFIVRLEGAASMTQDGIAWLTLFTNKGRSFGPLGEALNCGPKITLKAPDGQGLVALAGRQGPLLSQLTASWAPMCTGCSSCPADHSCSSALRQPCGDNQMSLQGKNQCTACDVGNVLINPLGARACPEACAGKAPYVNMAFGKLQLTSGYKAGSRATLVCDTGYGLYRPRVSTCVGTSWDTPIPAAAPECRKVCARAAVVANGWPVYEVDPPLEGTVVRYDCDPAYNLLTTTRTCVNSAFAAPGNPCLVPDMHYQEGPGNSVDGAGAWWDHRGLASAPITSVWVWFGADWLDGIQVFYGGRASPLHGYGYGGRREMKLDLRAGEYIIRVTAWAKDCYAGGSRVGNRLCICGLQYFTNQRDMFQGYAIGVRMDIAGGDGERLVYHYGRMGNHGDQLNFAWRKNGWCVDNRC